MTVAANVKQVLTIILAVLLFNLHISPLNGLGITVTLLGGATYAKFEYDSKKRQRNLGGATLTLSEEKTRVLEELGRAVENVRDIGEKV